MAPFNSARRELLRFCGIGLAAVATTAVPAAHAAAQRSANTSVALGIFDIRNYGAVGDVKAVDSPAINKAIEAAAAAGGRTVLFLPESG
jgi:polygalacturonase